jgi:ribosomal protein S12 methylthiotransferase
MRGPYRSRPAKSILNEAEFLVANGKKELILVSQEATLYGSDLDKDSDLVSLLEKLAAIDGLAWLRLLYLHPARTSDRLIEFVAESDKAVGYFDLPFQHINSDLLRAMKRETNRRTIENLLDRLRRRLPNATLRASFMVGFPGETDEQFEELYRFVYEQEFDRMGGFTFSAEEGTAAADLPNQLPEEVKTGRLDRLMTLQQEIAFEKNNSLIGNLMEVIIDTAAEDGTAVGRSPGDSPEIDQEVLVHGDNLRVGDICRVRIDGAQGYDLTGTLVTE